MIPVVRSLVKLKNSLVDKRGYVHEVEKDMAVVIWMDTHESSIHHISSLTSAYKPGDEVAHLGSHGGVPSLGHGTIVGTRIVADVPQHLVEFWESSTHRWLPWQRLQSLVGVLPNYKSLLTRPGDPEKLWLRNLAYALSEWDINTGGLSRLEIDPLPHQLYLVNKILSSGDLNWMIADDVGLGKTIEVGLLLTALRKRRYRRFLVIAPAGLTIQWAEELAEKFYMDDFVIYGEDATPTTPAQWRMYDRMIISMDRAKTSANLANILQADQWDLCIIDEAHRLSRHEKATHYSYTDRYKMAAAIRKKTNSLLLLSGTPHQGDDGLFRGLLELLRPGPAWKRRINNIRANPEVLANMIIRNKKAEVTDAHGRFIFHGKQTHTIAISRTPIEAQFDEALIQYLRKGYNASRHGDRTTHAIGFVMTTFRKLAASSTAAITTSLHRRLIKLIDEDKKNMTIYNEESLEEFDGRFIETDEMVSGAPKEFFHGEIPMLEALVKLGKKLIPIESKFVQLFEEIIPRILSTDTERKLLFFTEYRSTQRILVENLERLFGQNKVATIHGGQAMDQRRDAVDSFNTDYQFLVSTEAGGEGLNLHKYCNFMINVDLPWNPMRLVQRVGRLYRYGQERQVVVFNLKNEGSLDQEILGKMHERLDTIAKDMVSVTSENREGLIEDILGQIIGALEVEEVLESAMNSSRVQTEEALENALKRAQEAARVQDELLSFASGFEASTLQEQLHLSTAHLKKFVEAMFNQNEISIRQKVHDEDVWDISLPEPWQAEFGSKKNIRISFDRAKARRYNAELLDGDHYLLKALLETAKSWQDGKAAMIRLPEAQAGFTSLVRWLDERGAPAETGYISIIKNNRGEWEVNPAIWINWLLNPTLKQENDQGQPNLDYSGMPEKLLDYLRRHGPRNTIPDQPFLISGFAVRGFL